MTKVLPQMVSRRNKELNFRASHAFVIGINEYRGLDANLKTAVRDAEEVAMRLKTLQGFDNVLLMTDVGKAQLEQLFAWIANPDRSPQLLIQDEQFPKEAPAYSSRIAWLKLAEEVPEVDRNRLRPLTFEWEKQGRNGGPQTETVLLDNRTQIDIQPEDSVVFYYAGHGFPGEIKHGPAGYLSPTDAKNMLVENDSLIPMDTLYQALSKVDCKHTLLLLDCCFAGKFRFSSLSRGRPRPFLLPLYKKRFEKYKSSEAWQVLVSAGADQTANDSAKWAQIRHHSPFAATLKEALEGRADLHTFGNKTQGDGIITATELFLYVWNKVEAITGDVKPQHPGLFPMAQHREGEFIFLNPNVSSDQFKFAKDPDKNPYKGLLPYEPEDTNLFFGRDQALDSLLRKMKFQEKEKLPPVIFLTAPSAAGKSSLVKAGLFPTLHKTQGYDALLYFRPAPPDRVMGTTITPSEQQLEDNTIIKDFQRSEWTGFYELEQQLDPQKRQVILVDQFEELFTGLNTPEREQFEDALLAIIESPTPPLVIFTMRSDVEWQLPKTKLGGNYWKPEHIFRLIPMNLDELREALTGPAWWALYDFKDREGGDHTDDGEALLNQILEDVAYYPAALPLLSCVMEHFYETARERGKQQLVGENYQGVAGALSARAEAFYQELNTDEQQLMRKIMLRMVLLSDADFKGRKVTYSESHTDEHPYGVPPFELDYGEATREALKLLIDKMEKAHLVVQGKTHNNIPTIEPAHDALINHWPTCRQWVEDFEQENLLLQRQLWEAVVEHHTFQPDAYTTSEAPPLWDNNPKLQQLQRILTDPNDVWLCQKGWKSLSMSSFSYLLFGKEPSEEQLQTLSKFESYLLTEEEKRDSYSGIIPPQEVHRRILARMDLWLNQAELEFVRKSFEAQQTELERLIAQRNAEMEARKLAEERQREIAEMARRMSLQTQAFKKKYQEQTKKDLLFIQKGIKPNLHLILVGIDEHQDSRIPPLRGPVNDVKQAATAFQAQKGKLYEQVFTHLIINEAATKANILAQVANVQREADRFDFVLLYLSGQGIAYSLNAPEKTFINQQPEHPHKMDGAFLPYDAVADSSELTMLPGRELCDLLMQFQAKVILISDFCHSGEFLSRLAEANQSGDPNLIAHNVFGLSGSSPGEICYELKINGQQRGIFSYAFTESFTKLDADLDGNGVLYLDELLQFTSNLVSERFDKQHVFTVVPATMTNIPLIQFGDTFSLPEKEILLGGHIEEDRVIESIMTRFPQLAELEEQYQSDYDQIIESLKS